MVMNETSRAIMRLLVVEDEYLIRMLLEEEGKGVFQVRL